MLALTVSRFAFGVRRLRSLTSAFVFTMCVEASAFLCVALNRIRNGTFPFGPVTLRITVALVLLRRTTFTTFTFRAVPAFELLPPVLLPPVLLPPLLLPPVGVGAVLVLVDAGPTWAVIGNGTFRERRIPSSTNNAITFTVVVSELKISTAARPCESVNGQIRFVPAASAAAFRPALPITMFVPAIGPEKNCMPSAFRFTVKHTVSPTNGAPVMSCASATQIAASCSTGCDPFGKQVIVFENADVTVFVTVFDTTGRAVTGSNGYRIVAEMFAVPSVVIPLRSQPPFELIATPGRCVKKKFVPGKNNTRASPCSSVYATDF